LAHGERRYRLGLNAVHRSTLIFLTNNFTLAASTIAAIYKARWQIELFFKWIKQNLKIKLFLGTSRNAVMTQVWVAMCSYLLLAYIKYQTKYAHSLLELSRVIGEMLMERKSLIAILSLKPEKLRGGDCEPIQAVLFLSGQQCRDIKSNLHLWRDYKNLQIRSLKLHYFWRE
jgi:hypothetical protein